MPLLAEAQTDAANKTEIDSLLINIARNNNAKYFNRVLTNINASKINKLNLNNPFYINSGNLDVHLGSMMGLSGSNLIVNQFGSGASGIVSASGGGTTNFLRADNTWTVPAGTLPSGSSNGQLLYYNGSAAAWTSINDSKWDNSNKRFVLGDGNGAGAVADASIGNLKSYFSTSDASIFHVGGYFQSQQTAATTNSIQGLEGYTKVSHSSGTVTLAIGTIGNIELSTTQTLSLARSLQAGGNLTAAGVVTEWDGLYINLANSGGATVSTGVGVYVDNFPSGVTTKYNFYSADGTGIQRFAGSTYYVPVDLGSVGTSQNDYAIGAGTTFKINATAGISITGIQQGAEGRIIYITNTNASNTITFPDNSGSSSSGNKFAIPGGFTLAAGNTCQFVYISSFWRLSAKTN